MVVVVGQLLMDQLEVLRNINSFLNLLHIAALEEVRELPKKVTAASTRI